MRRNVIETVMGAVVLLVAIGFVVFAFRASGISAAGGYRIDAVFNDASGLAVGTDVRMAGVKVGTVVAQSLDTETYQANITLEIDESIKLPSDSSARILPDGLLGGNFVSLEPGAEEDLIPNGGRIEFTQSAINVVELLGRFIFGSAESEASSSGP
jgi:phospholipid/cholesterol/gamma-HCH transport system substrate-binding protein